MQGKKLITKKEKELCQSVEQRLMNEAIAKIQERERNREQWFRNEMKNNQYLNNLNTLYKHKVTSLAKPEMDKASFLTLGEQLLEDRKQNSLNYKLETLDQIKMNSIEKRQRKEREQQENLKIIQAQIEGFNKIDRTRHEFLTKINLLNDQILSNQKRGLFANNYTYAQKQRDQEMNSKYIPEQQQINERLQMEETIKQQARKYMSDQVMSQLQGQLDQRQRERELQKELQRREGNTNNDYHAEAE